MMHNIKKIELCKWLDKIGYRIFLIKKSRKQYNTFLENYKNGTFKSFDNEFLLWVKRNYECTIIMLLAGLLEGSKRKDDLNFQNFLTELEKYGLDKLKAELYTDKHKYFSDFDNIEFKTFDDNDLFELERQNYIKSIFEKLNIEIDIQNINTNFLKFKTMRDKKIAHFTDCSENIKFENIELDNIIDEIINIFEIYAFIIKQASYTFD